MADMARQSSSLLNFADINRRMIVFLAILMSGGNLILPREPLLVVFFFLTFLSGSLSNIIRRELLSVWLVLVAVLVIGIVGAQTIQLQAIAVRYGVFLGGLAFVAVYLDLPKSRLIKDLTPLLMFFALQSILTPIFAILVPQFFISFSVDGMTYHSFLGIFTYHETVVGAGMLGLKRPDGFFFEPGVLQIYLNILLHIGLFVTKSTRHSVLAFFGVLATQSTTGVLISVVLVAWYFVNFLRKQHAPTQIVALVGAPFIGLPIAYIAYQNVIEKLFGATRGSALAREYDLRTGLGVIKEHPWTGIGFDQERYLELARQFMYASEIVTGHGFERGNTNGLITLAYTVGIPMFLVFIYGYAKQRFFPNSLMFLFLITTSLLTETLALTVFFVAIFFSGLIVAKKRVSAPNAAPAYRNANVVTR